MSRKGGLSTTRYSSDSSITVKPCGILARSTRVGDKAGLSMISLKNVTRYYRSGERSVHALDGISLEIADEPTGNLDTISASHIMNVFKQIVDDKLTTLIVVTHSVEVAQAASRRIKMRDGKIVDDR